MWGPQAHHRARPGSAAGADDCSAEALDGTRRWVRTKEGALFELGQPRHARGAEEGTPGGPLSVLAAIDGEEAKGGAADGAAAVVGAAKGVGAVMGPGLMAGGALIAASMAAYRMLGHHTVDVSVFSV